MIIKYQDSSKAVAEELSKYLLSICEQKEKVFIAVSGGNTPKELFDWWTEYYKETLPWDKIELYWVDERCVPPTDKDSNYGMTKRHLLDHVALNPSQIFRIQGENNPEKEAQRYSNVVLERLPKDEFGNPIFDLVILGVGNDGHTSSIFPGQEKLLTTKFPFAQSIHPQNKIERIAMTGAPILAAKHLVFHVVGSSKNEILKQIIKAENQSIYPAAWIIHKHPNPIIFTDQDIKV